MSKYNDEFSVRQIAQLEKMFTEHETRIKSFFRREHYLNLLRDAKEHEARVAGIRTSGEKNGIFAEFADHYKHPRFDENGRRITFRERLAQQT